MAHTSDKTPVLAIQRIWTRQDKMSLIKAIADLSILHSNDEFGDVYKKAGAWFASCFLLLNPVVFYTLQ